MRVRNTGSASRGDWATFAKAAREGADDGRGISQSELARRMEIDRVTLWRWENGKQKPENADVVARFARATGVQTDEALAAAGLRPGEPVPTEPTRDYDEEIEFVRSHPDLTARQKLRLLEMIADRRARERQQALEDTQRMIEALQERGAS